MIVINQGDTQPLRIELFTETGEPWTPTDEIILFCICTKTGILLSTRATAQGEVFLSHNVFAVSEFNANDIVKFRAQWNGGSGSATAKKIRFRIAKISE